MKIYIIIFCLFLSISTYSQISKRVSDTIASHKITDTSSAHSSIIGPCLPSITNIEPFYVINDKYCNKIPTDLDVNNILSLDVLKDKTAIAIYGNKAKDGAVIIITKPYAIASYENKFSKISKKYKKYLNHHHGDDSACFYVVNGEPVEGKENEIIGQLFNIPSNKIKSVACLDVGDQWRNGNNTKEVVIIVTNKN